MQVKRLLCVLFVALAWFGCADLPHDSPYDSDAPFSKQAKGSVSGTVKLEGEQDHGQIAVELINQTRSYAANSRNDGSFELTGIVPGSYTLRFTARSFMPVERSVEVALAEALNLGEITLAPKTATVQGNAWLEMIDGKTPQNIGGVLVSLVQTASARGAAKTPGLRSAAASVTGSTQRSFTIVSDSDGSYRIYAVPSASYRVSASSPGIAESDLGEIVITGEDGDITIDDVILRPLTGLFDIDDGLAINPPYTSAASVTLRLFGFNALEMAVDVTTTADNCRPLVRRPYASTLSIPLAGEGPNIVCVKYFAEGDAETDTLTRTVVRDTNAPDATLFQINGGALATTNPDAGVMLSIVAVDASSGVKAMKVANAAVGGCDSALTAASGEPFVSLKSWVLAKTPESRNYVCLALQDAVGNWSLPVSTSIVWDSSAPSGESISVAGNAAYTTSTRVTVQLAAVGASEMQLTDDGSFAGRPWEPFRSSIQWTLPDIDGPYTLTVRYRDSAGNLSGEASDGIELDSLPPSATGLTIEGGAAYVTSATVALALAAVDAVAMQLSDDGLFDTEPEQAFDNTASFALAGTDGTKFVYARFRDLAGNWSGVASAYVVLDRSAPVAGTPLINGGAAYTQIGSVTLTLPAAGATQMYLSTAGCLSGSGWLDYVPSTAYDLGGTQGLRTVYAAYRDEAGNVSPCKQASITQDGAFVSPGFAAAITGTEGIAGRTKNLTVWLTMSGVSADVTEVALAGDASFSGAAWQTKAGKFSFTLSSGDGVKTVFVRARDAAGNMSTTLQPSITLDQTGPEAPAISVSDITGDSFAVSESQVELRWTAPSDLNLAGFEVERYIPGYTTSFARISSAGPATFTYTDAITESVGLVHVYRVRAFDNLNNYSGWSSNIEAFPFESVSQAAWLINSEGLRYLFAPERGTFSLRVTRSYEDVYGSLTEEDLGVDLVAWQHTGSGGQYGEKLYIKTVNQDNTLAYESVIPTREAQRSRIASVYQFADLDVDPQGVPHVLSCDYPKLGYRVRNGAVWSAQSPGVNYCWHPSFSLDQSGKAHIVYTLQTSPYSLLYLTNKSGVWVNETVGTYGGFLLSGPPPVVAAGADGIVHVVKTESGSLTYYRRATDGTWTSEAMFAGTAAALAVDAAGTPYVSYRDGTSVVVAYRTGAATWSKTTVDADANGCNSTSLRIDTSGDVHVAFAAPTQAKVRYAKSPAYTPEDVGAVSSNFVVSLAVDGKGRPYVGYVDYPGGAVVLAGKTTAWAVETIDVVSNPYKDQVGVGVDAAGNVHAAYTDVDSGALMYYSRAIARTDELVQGGSGDMTMLVDGADKVHVLFARLNFSSNPYYSTNAGGTWQETSIETGFAMQYPSLALDPWGGVHAVYTNNGASLIRYGQRSAGGAWSLQTIDSGTRAKVAVDAAGSRLVVYGSGSGLEYATAPSGGSFTANQSLGAGGYPDLVMDESGTVHLVYANSGIRYRSRAGGTWSAQQTVDATPGSYQTSIAVRGGVPHIAFIDTSKNLVYAVLRSGVWSKTVVDRGITASDSPAISVLADGSAAILYDDYATTRIKFATNASGGWTVSRFATGERQVELRVGPGDSVHAAYVGTPSDSWYGLHHLRDFFGIMPAVSTTRVSAW